MTFTLDRVWRYFNSVTVKCNWHFTHTNTQSEWIPPRWPLENSCLFSDRLRPGVPQVKLHCVDLVQQFNKKQKTARIHHAWKSPNIFGDGWRQRTKGDPLCHLNKATMFLLERNREPVVVVFLFSVYVVLALIVLIQATDRRDPERDSPLHSTLLSLFYFSHVVGRGKEGSVLFQNQIQTPSWLCPTQTLKILTYSV